MHYEVERNRTWQLASLLMTIIVVGGADVDLSAGCSEFHGVVDQIPKHLLEAYRIGQDVMLVRVQLSRKL